MFESGSPQVVALHAPAMVDGEEIHQVVGENLRRIRIRKGLSLERLAKSSGVSRAMLGQVELGRSAPTISVLWKIARALDVPLTAFTSPDGGGKALVFRAHRAKVLASLNGRFSSRALFPTESSQRVEFYEVKIAPHTVEEADGHLPGTIENMVVAQGSLEIEAGGDRYQLAKGDSIQFIADQPHRYRNAGSSEVLVYLVMVYAG